MENQEETTEETSEETEIPLEEKTDTIIYRHMLFAMTAGAIPIPFIDVAAVTAIQLDMIRQLAEEYSIDYNNEMGKSIASSLTGATLARAGASAIKAIPGVGTWLGITAQAILSGASTYALGNIFRNHFSEDGDLFDINVEQMKEKYEEYLEKGKEVAKKLKREAKEEDDLSALDKLHKLKESGAISEEEYEKAKKGILDKLASGEKE
ncbi:MAG: DUF697 domain-containing protein [Spirochaetota bacterium]